MTALHAVVVFIGWPVLLFRAYWSLCVFRYERARLAARPRERKP